jgi:hypothetical protein
MSHQGNPNSLANLQKPKPFNERPDFKELSSKGGIASGEAKRRIKSMKEMMRVLLDELDPDHPDRTNLESVCIAQLKQAMRGQTKAAEFVMKSSGNEPEKEVVIKDLRTVPYVVDESQDTTHE